MSFIFPSKKDFKPRYCFKCKKKIDFGGFLLRNKTLSDDILNILWEHDNLEYFCCSCYDSLVKKENLTLIVTKCD